MKIDLRKDKGILKAANFSSLKQIEQELSEDELIAETLRRRHTGVKADDSVEQDSHEKSPVVIPAKKTKRSSFILFLFLVIVLSASAYYFHDRGQLLPSVDIVKTYWMDVMGIPLKKEVVLPVFSVDDSLIVEDILSEDLFNQLMPVTEHIAAIADSIAALPAESLFIDPMQISDEGEDSSEYLPVADEPIQLSDDDIKIIDNRSLLLLLTEIIDNYPIELGQGHLFLKRDALTITAPQGGAWVNKIKAALDQFVLGSFDESYSPGVATLKSKFSIIINAEQDFQVQVLDVMRLFDALAQPFDEYLQEIIVDLSGGISDNPAKFTFTGSPQEMQYILSYWAETRTNFLLRSVDIEFQDENLILSLDVIFFTYTP